MANPNISAVLTAAQKTTLKSNVNANKALIALFGGNQNASPELYGNAGRH